MIVIFSELHQGHAPESEFYRGERVPCFESPQRAEIVHEELTNRGYELTPPSGDSGEILQQVHSMAYLNFLQSAWQQWLALDAKNSTLQPFPSVWPIRSLRSDIEPENFVAKLGLYSMDNGSPLDAGTWQAAKAGADAAFTAAKLLIGGEKSIFCASRPPGHHAGRDFMGGYCFLNNAAVAAQTLRSQGCQRVAILDVDYHHGNGTQSIFYDRDDVLFASIHGDPSTEFPFYLGGADEQGEGAGYSYNCNYPLAVGSAVTEWFAALELASERILSYKADALVVSLGLDTFVNDPISGFRLELSDFRLLGKRLQKLGLPCIFIFEGGYATSELGLNTCEVLEAYENR